MIFVTSFCELRLGKQFKFLIRAKSPNSDFISFNKDFSPSGLQMSMKSCPIWEFRWNHHLRSFMPFSFGSTHLEQTIDLLNFWLLGSMLLILSWIGLESWLFSPNYKNIFYYLILDFECEFLPLVFTIWTVKSISLIFQSYLIKYFWRLNWAIIL